MDKKKIEKAIRMVLEAIGEDPQRRDLEGTPERVADMYEEIFAGLREDPKKELEVILDQKHEEIVLLKDIPLYSVCEHHLIPFIGRAHVAYIPKGGRVTGLSKIARVVEILSKRPQVQERLTTQVAGVIMEKLKPLGVMVVIEAEHLCLSMRGVKKPRGLQGERKDARGDPGAHQGDPVGLGALFDNCAGLCYKRHRHTDGARERRQWGVLERERLFCCPGGVTGLERRCGERAHYFLG